MTLGFLIMAAYVFVASWAWFVFLGTWLKYAKDPNILPRNLIALNRTFSSQVSTRTYVRGLFVAALICTLGAIFIPPWLADIVERELSRSPPPSVQGE